MLGIISSFLATFNLNAPKVGSTTEFLSATNSTTSPFSAPQVLIILLNSSSVKNFLKPQDGSSSTQRINARPLAPIPLTYSVNLSTSFLVNTDAEFFATIQRTLPPFLTAPENTPKPQSLTTSETSQIPYRNEHQAYQNHNDS